MSKFKLILISFLSFASVAFLSGCDKTDQPENNKNELEKPGIEYIRSLTRGETSVAYERTSVRLFDQAYDGTGKWTEINTDEMIGWSILSPSTLTITEGRAWTELSLFNPSIGFNPLYLPWAAYCRVTGFDKSLWIAAPVTYDEETNLLTLHGREYSVTNVGTSTLSLSTTSEYYKGDLNAIEFKPAGQIREDARYVKTELQLEDRDKMLYFDSEKDAYRTMIQMIREKFGDRFNLNDYFGGSIILDEPMVDLDEIEKQLLG